MFDKIKNMLGIDDINIVFQGDKLNIVRLLVEIDDYQCVLETSNREKPLTFNKDVVDVIISKKCNKYDVANGIELTFLKDDGNVDVDVSERPVHYCTRKMK